MRTNNAILMTVSTIILLNASAAFSMQTIISCAEATSENGNLEQQLKIVNSLKVGNELDTRLYSILKSRLESAVGKFSKQISEADRQDIVAMAITKIMLGIRNRKLDQPKYLFTWSTRIAINEALIYLRHRRNVDKYIDENLQVVDSASGPKAGLISLETVPSREVSVLDNIIFEQEHSPVFSALNQTSPAFSEIFIRYQLFYQPLGAIASVMGLNTNTVKTKLFRGRADLKLLVEREQMRQKSRREYKPVLTAQLIKVIARLKVEERLALSTKQIITAKLDQELKVFFDMQSNEEWLSFAENLKLPQEVFEFLIDQKIEILN
jgi:RNA polymerase sigma factor (sigma-70 family)